MATSALIVAFRVHYWDDAVEFAFRQLREATTARIVICADETNGPVPTPPGIEKLSHTVDTFRQMGFPPLPSPELMLWYASDLLFYLLEERFTFDYLLMIEGDCVVTGPLDRLIGEAATGMIDLMVNRLRPLSAGPRWEPAQLALGEPGTPVDLFTCFFAVILVSQRAVAALREARLVKTGDGAAGWAYCEDFVPTVLARRGFSSRSLGDFADVTRLMWDRPVKPMEVPPPDDKVRFFHPVLNSPRYEAKLNSRLDRFEADVKERQAAQRRFKRDARELRAQIVTLEEENRRLRRLLRFWQVRNWRDYSHILMRRLGLRRQKS